MVGRDGFEPSYLSEQIYSLSPLTTRPPAQTHKNGADDGTRTRNLLITNQLLYQLSYIGLVYAEN